LYGYQAIRKHIGTMEGVSWIHVRMSINHFYKSWLIYF
jgi:hypothetical protein